ncbi:MAG TPA: NUDIX domain-containing protein [Armatimonadota bacterium]|jgi:8-oxo-dGTP pyrophosphatase MutT (NUDIX family)
MRSIIGQRLLLLVGSGVLVLDTEGRLLLHRRSDNGCWGIPGGCMEPGETLEETARREVLEETGLRLGELTLYGVFSGPEYTYHYPNGDLANTVSIIYLARMPEEEPIHAPSSETLELGFFDPHDLPEDISPPVIPVLQHYVRSLRTGPG